MAVAKVKTRRNLHVRKGDTVHIIAGKERGAFDALTKRGKVLKVLPEKNRIIVERINIIKRHQRPSKTNQQGGIVEREAPIHVSNAMVVCPKCTKPTRIGYEILKDGSKVRVCKKCGEHID